MADQQLADVSVTEAKNLERGKLTAALYIAHHTEIIQHHDSQNNRRGHKHQYHDIHNIHKAVVGVHDPLLLLLACDHRRIFDFFRRLTGKNRCDMIIDPCMPGICIGHYNCFGQNRTQIACYPDRVGLFTSIWRKFNHITDLCHILEPLTKVYAVVGKRHAVVVFINKTNQTVFCMIYLKYDGFSL